MFFGELDLGIPARRLLPALEWLLPALLLGLLPGAASPLLAQSIDPGVLQSLQSQLGGTSSLDSSSAASRRSNAVPERSEQALPQGRIDTIEEQEVRRAEARRNLQRLYMPSRIERDYRERLDVRDLRQFGYDFFQSSAPPTGSRVGTIGDDYVLGVGDEMRISFRGATNQSQTVRVDRDGRILVDGLAPLSAAGRSLGQVRRELEAETARSMLATDIFVSMGEVRAISVFVGGEVERPGQFILTSMSGVATAIAAAGGVRRSGSLRQLRLVRASGESITVDLYGLLGIGRPPTVHLRDGDRVIVPVIGPTVAVTGVVARPGIYELRGRQDVAEVVGFAGGAIRQRGAQVVISRIAGDGSEDYVRASSGSELVSGGDAIEVIGGSAGGATDRVRLEGAVANPGSRSLKSAATVADLVGPAAHLPADTYQLAAVLLRRDPGTGARVYQMIGLAQELRGLATTRLRPDDRLFVLSRQDIRFMNSAPVRRVVLGQPNPLRQCRSLRHLETLVKDTAGSRFNAVTRGGFVIVSEEGADLGAVGSALGQSSRQATDLAVSGELERLNEDRAMTEMQPQRMPGQTNPGYDEQQGAFAETAREPLCTDIFEQEPELLAILLEHSISIGGAVRNPGAYPVTSGVTAQDLSLAAGGILAGASDLVLDITRARDGSAAHIAVGDGGGDAELARTQLAIGDDVRFNARQPEFEGSAVLLAGEVRRPGLYAIRKGETLSELLERAGGVTEYGYSYGTVFTRRSVKESQQEGFRRTARELNNSLLAVAARSRDSSGQGLLGAASLVRSLSQTEASGRMVVEADPRVLALRPDLDTILESGDSIFVPKRPNFVLALGDVNNPGALQFVVGKSAGDYLKEAGGILSTADSKRAFMVLPDGTAQPLRSARWNGSDRVTPPPGTTIIVPKNIDPLYKLSIFRDVTTIVAQMATSVATVAVLATR